MNKICFGCGIRLQTDEALKGGYIPVQKLGSADYCQRCFKMMHYGEVSLSGVPKTALGIIDSINRDDKHVLFLVDFLSLSKENMELFHKIKGSKTLIISKADILPKQIREINVKNFLKYHYAIKGEIRFVSSLNNRGVEPLINYLSRTGINEAYIVGESNSGKSSLINKMIDSSLSAVSKLTTSKHANTTLDFIRIKISRELTLIDSPGFVLPETILKPHLSKGPLKPKVYQMKSGEKLVVGSIYISFDNDTSAVIYASNEINVKKYYKEIKFDSHIKVNNNTDILILGMGFIHVKNKCKVSIKGISENLIEVRESMIGEAHE